MHNRGNGQRHKFAYLFFSLLLAIAALVLNQAANATGESKITGTIKFEGTPPRPRSIDMSNEPACAQQHAEHPATSEKVLVGPNGGLANVVVYISEGLSESALKQVSSKPVELNQRGCQYFPRVVAINPQQDLKVVNSDPAPHNVHILPAKSPELDQSQPKGAVPFDVKFDHEEIAIQVRCNIHPWMRGYIAVVKGPYAVSDRNGSFTLDGFTPGSYTLTAWQETYGTQTQKVTVPSGKPTTVNFVFNAK